MRSDARQVLTRLGPVSRVGPGLTSWLAEVWANVLFIGHICVAPGGAFAVSWPTLCILSIAPRSPAVRVRGQEPARSAIQDIKETIAVGLSKQVLVAGIYHHWNLRGIPVVLVVPRKLEIPVQFAIVRIQSQKAVAVKISAGSPLPSI